MHQKHTKYHASCILQHTPYTLRHTIYLIHHNTLHTQSVHKYNIHHTTHRKPYLLSTSMTSLGSPLKILDPATIMLAPAAVARSMVSGPNPPSTSMFSLGRSERRWVTYIDKIWMMSEGAESIHGARIHHYASDAPYTIHHLPYHIPYHIPPYTTLCIS